MIGNAYLLLLVQPSDMLENRDTAISPTLEYSFLGVS